jgi:hypothetical protein
LPCSATRWWLLPGTRWRSLGKTRTLSRRRTRSLSGLWCKRSSTIPWMPIWTSVGTGSCTWRGHRFGTSSQCWPEIGWSGGRIHVANTLWSRIISGRLSRKMRLTEEVKEKSTKYSALVKMN